MARAIWSGAINFGLVTIPVKLMTAIREKSIHFNLLHGKDMGRIHNERVCDNCGKKIDWDDLVRGYPVEKDHYVVVSDEDLQKAHPEATQSVDIVAFASLDEIDPIYFDTPYYLEPEKRGRHAYALLREALRRSGRVGIAKVVIRTKEHLAALKPDGDGLVLELMHWHDEVVPQTDLALPPAKEDVPATEMKAALMLIDGMTQKFDAAKFHDTYREQLLDLVEKRAEGKAPVVHAAHKPAATNVVDLADVLQRSLEAHRDHPAAHGPHGAANDGASRNHGRANGAHRAGPRVAKPKKRASGKAHGSSRRKTA